jgi:hypothetical protein
VLVAGGYNGSEYSASAELYDEQSGTWLMTQPLFDARLRHTATRLTSGGILVVGGFPSVFFSTLLSTAEIYDEGTGTWSGTIPLFTARVFHKATLLPSGNVLVVGGIDNHFQRLASAELWE